MVEWKTGIEYWNQQFDAKCGFKQEFIMNFKPLLFNVTYFTHPDATCVRMQVNINMQTVSLYATPRVV